MRSAFAGDVIEPDATSRRAAYYGHATKLARSTWRPRLMYLRLYIADYFRRRARIEVLVDPNSRYARVVKRRSPVSATEKGAPRSPKRDPRRVWRASERVFRRAAGANPRFCVLPASQLEEDQAQV
jgi:hypothetical protein